MSLEDSNRPSRKLVLRCRKPVFAKSYFGMSVQVPSGALATASRLVAISM
jgi:hypothetical protein